MKKKISKKYLSIGLAMCIVLAGVMFVLRGELVVPLYSVLYKQRTQTTLEAAHKELDDPLVYLGAKDNRSASYHILTSCYYNKPPAVEQEGVGCLASIDANRMFKKSSNPAATKLEIDRWIDSLGHRLEEHGWKATAYGMSNNGAQTAIYDLKKIGNHDAMYQKNMHGGSCSLTVSADTANQDFTDPTPVNELPFITGHLICYQ